LPTADAVIVVGSGPAGVAAASALAERGIAVTVLDAGREIPAPARELIAPLADHEPREWPVDAADALRAATHAATRGQAERSGESAGVDAVNRTVKPVFGSLFPYAIDDATLPLAADDAVSIYPSLQRGGLSLAWGAAILPFAQDDLAGWPIALGDLEEHYRAVLRYLPLTGARDTLAERYPLYADEVGDVEQTPQMSAFLADLSRSAGRLQAAGTVAGRARLALWADRCRRVGLCLHGCPYGAIWSSAQRLDELVAAGRVSYESGVVVERFEEAGGRLTLHVRGADGQRRESRDAARVLIACGPLASTRILLGSTGRREALLRDSQIVAVPLLRARGAPVSVDESGNTLAQAFLEIRDPAVSEGTVHVQVYGFNDRMLAEAATMARLPEARAERLLRPVLGRVLFAQGYLHSAESGAVRVRLGPDGTLRLSGEPNPATDTAVRRVLRRLVRLAPALGAVPLLPMASRGLIGTGNHAGGALPMRERPGPDDSDTLGRPHGFERVHFVDSTVFPTVPAPTITLSVMANATRIAATVADS
jgi:choline dehydrogenase-like flavoprotein